MIAKQWCQTSLLSGTYPRSYKPNVLNNPEHWSSYTINKAFVQFIQMCYLLVKVTYGDCMVHYVIHSCMYLSRWDSIITHLGKHWSRALWIRRFSLHSVIVVPSFLIINLFCHCSAVILSKGYKFDSNGRYTSWYMYVNSSRALRGNTGHLSERVGISCIEYLDFFFFSGRGWGHTFCVSARDLHVFLSVKFYLNSYIHKP